MKPIVIKGSTDSGNYAEVLKAITKARNEIIKGLSDLRGKISKENLKVPFLVVSESETNEAVLEDFYNEINKSLIQFNLTDFPTGLNKTMSWDMFFKETLKKKFKESLGNYFNEWLFEYFKDVLEKKKVIEPAILSGKGINPVFFSKYYFLLASSALIVEFLHDISLKIFGPLNTLKSSESDKVAGFLVKDFEKKLNLDSFFFNAFSELFESAVRKFESRDAFEELIFLGFLNDLIRDVHLKFIECLDMASEVSWITKIKSVKSFTENPVEISL